MSRERRGRGPGRGQLTKVQGEDGPLYFGDWVDARGVRHRQALSNDRRVAERMLADIVRKRDLQRAGLEIEDGFDLDIQELVGPFLADLRSRCCAPYAHRAEQCLNKLIKDMKARCVRDLRCDAVLRYRQRRVRAGAANRTINMEVTVLKTMLNWSVRAGLIAANPVAPLKMLPQGKANQKIRRRALTEEEVLKFIAASWKLDQKLLDHWMALRTIEGGTKGEPYAQIERVPRVPQTPLWLALIQTGARWGEVTSLTWSDFDEEHLVITFRAETTKGRKERSVPITRELADELLKLKVAHHALRESLPRASEPIFLTACGAKANNNRVRALRLLRDTLELAGIPWKNELGRSLDIHALRHTFASRLARVGVPLQQAQKLLGHSDPKLTAAIYTHLEVEDLRGAVEKLPSLSLPATPVRAPERSGSSEGGAGAAARPDDEEHPAPSSDRSLRRA